MWKYWTLKKLKTANPHLNILNPATKSDRNWPMDLDPHTQIASKKHIFQVDSAVARVVPSACLRTLTVSVWTKPLAADTMVWCLYQLSVLPYCALHFLPHIIIWVNWLGSTVLLLVSKTNSPAPNLRHWLNQYCYYWAGCNAQTNRSGFSLLYRVCCVHFLSNYCLLIDLC